MDFLLRIVTVGLGGGTLESDFMGTDTSEKRSETATSGPWQRQFDPVYDFPPTLVTTKLALLTTPRCGSHFLGHRLRETGGFGYPLEYCNSGNWRHWRHRAREAGAAGVLDYIKSVRTGPNGVFAIKLHFEHLEKFLAEEDDPLSYVFVHLRRENLLAQAASFARAQQTGAWISDMPERGAARYDYDLIASKVTAVATGNAGWEAFLAATGREALQMTYEQVARDPSAAVRAIADHAGVTLAEASLPADFAPERQKSGKREDWPAMFRAETEKRLRSGQFALPGLSQGDTSKKERLVDWARMRLDDLRGASGGRD